MAEIRDQVQDTVRETVQQAGQELDGLHKTIQTAVDAAISNLQPHLNESMNQFAERAIDATQGAARQLVSSARRNPWYFVAGAAGVLLLAGLFITYSATDSRRESNYL